MNTQVVNKDIVFINPYDIKGGASMGTFRLFSYFQEFISSSVRLLVVVKSSRDPLVYGLSFLFRFLFYSQAGFNKLLCRLISKKNLPVAFTFFVPFSLPAIALFLKGRNAASVYLHSMSSGFACPLSFYLLLRKASVVKTADDWYLTGGCHYSFDCNQWKSGCSSCPYMNSIGRLIVRLNWYFKRKVLGIFSHCSFISPSHWLSSRYKNLYSDRCLVVYNSASSSVVNLLSPPSVSTSSSQKHIGNISSSVNSVSLGLPVTYLRDRRKGFLDVLPSLIECLEKYPVRLFLCGVDSDAYLDHILSTSLSLHPDSCIESLGFLSPIEMSTFYSKLDFLMHFAQYDNSPNVVTESLCSGIPVIVLDNSGSPEHVRFSSAGFVLSDLKQLSSVVASISSSLVDVESLKRKALNYSETVLSPRAMALSYSRFLK